MVQRWRLLPAQNNLLADSSCRFLEHSVILRVSSTVLFVRKTEEIEGRYNETEIKQTGNGEIEGWKYTRIVSAEVTAFLYVMRLQLTAASQDFDSCC